ncbi:MAG: hypothetical protein IJ459_03180, partial [Clostridia bacterium]|nr:hypothetical protein [Clostridia bacterium]
IVTDDEKGKVLHISKGSSGQDESGAYITTNCGVSLTQYVTLKEEGAKVMVFEADIKASNVTYGDYIQIHVNGEATGTKNSPLLGLLRLSATEGAVIKNASSNTEGGNTSAKMGEWFHLRIEYKVTETDADGNITGIEYKFIVNDDAPIVGTTVYKKAISVDSITSLVFAFNNKNLGDFYVDNSSLKLVQE